MNTNDNKLSNRIAELAGVKSPSRPSQSKSVSPPIFTDNYKQRNTKSFEKNFINEMTKDSTLHDYIEKNPTLSKFNIEKKPSDMVKGAPQKDISQGSEFLQHAKRVMEESYKHDKGGARNHLINNPPPRKTTSVYDDIQRDISPQPAQTKTQEQPEDDRPDLVKEMTNYSGNSEIDNMISSYTEKTGVDKMITEQPAPQPAQASAQPQPQMGAEAGAMPPPPAGDMGAPPPDAGAMPPPPPEGQQIQPPSEEEKEGVSKNQLLHNVTSAIKKLVDYVDWDDEPDEKVSKLMHKVQKSMAKEDPTKNNLAGMTILLSAKDKLDDEWQKVITSNYKKYIMANSGIEEFLDAVSNKEVAEGMDDEEMEDEEPKKEKKEEEQGEFKNSEAMDNVPDAVNNNKQAHTRIP